MDDGTICRLDDDTFYVDHDVERRRRDRGVVRAGGSPTGTSTSALTDVTQALRGGQPRRPAGARDPRRPDRRSTCSAEAFAYLDGKRSARSAGVHALLLRIGFVGEVGYEIHFPAAYGEHVWDALIAAGARPFGLEPQRILRLQKLHVIVGQDTDSESHALRRRDAVDRQARQGAGLHRPLGARARRRAAGGDRAGRLHDAERRTCPTEGAVVLPRRRAARSRRAPLAAARRGDRDGVGAGGAGRGRRPAITISDEGAPTGRVVTTSPFYDPEGEVLRS